MAAIRGHFRARVERSGRPVLSAILLVQTYWFRVDQRPVPVVWHVLRCHLLSANSAEKSDPLQHKSLGFSGGADDQNVTDHCSVQEIVAFESRIAKNVLNRFALSKLHLIRHSLSIR